MPVLPQSRRIFPREEKHEFHPELGSRMFARRIGRRRSRISTGVPRKNTDAGRCGRSVSNEGWRSLWTSSRPNHRRWRDDALTRPCPRRFYSISAREGRDQLPRMGCQQSIRYGASYLCSTRGTDRRRRFHSRFCFEKSGDVQHGLQGEWSPHEIQCAGHLVYRSVTGRCGESRLRRCTPHSSKS